MLTWITAELALFEKVETSRHEFRSADGRLCIAALPVTP
jgi:hypothetical protein